MHFETMISGLQRKENAEKEGENVMETIKNPRIKENVYIAPGAVVYGDVTLHENVSVWFHAVIRAEEGTIVIGSGSNVQDGCVIHVDKGTDVVVGTDVTIGHNAIVHGCTIGDNTIVGMGAIVMNHAVVGKNCIVAAGALVTEHTVIPDNSLVMGSPARIKRMLTPEEIEHNRYNAEHYVKEAALAQDFFASGGAVSPNAS